MKRAIKILIVFFLLMMAVLTAFLAWMLYQGRGARAIWETKAGSGFYQAGLVNTRSMAAAEISAVNVEHYNSDVYFIQGEDSQIVLKEYVAGQAEAVPPVTVSMANGTLRLVVEPMTANHGIAFGMASFRRYLEIYLPKDWNGSLETEGSSGSVYGEMDLNLTKCSIKTTSGAVRAKTLRADTIRLETSSGKVAVETLAAQESISIKATSGAVQVFDCTGDADISTSSGRISVDQAAGNLRLSASSGQIQAGNLTGGAQVNTSSGAVRLRFATLTGDVEIKCSSGSISCELPRDAEFSFQAKTSSGSIKTYFEDQLSFNKRGNQAEGVIGAADSIRVRAETTSGAIRFN